MGDRHDRVLTAIRSLARLQRKSGEFPTYWSRSPLMSAEEYVESPFITGMIVLALAKHPEWHGLRTHALGYLLTKRAPDGLFAFLNSGIRPDLDDTALLNTVLQRYLPLQYDYLSTAERIAREPKVDGAFETWIGPDGPNPVDPCVSINVVRFLHVNGIRSIETEVFLRDTLMASTFDEPTFYYESGLFPLYFALTLPAPLRQRVLPGWPSSLSARLLARAAAPCSCMDDVLLLFCAARASLSLDALATLSARVLHWQRPDGLWPSCAAFRAFNFWGSSALTTALAIEALSAVTQSDFGLASCVAGTSIAGGIRRTAEIVD